MKDRGGKRGPRSVDLPVRASSSSVARLLLLGADQRSTLRGAPSPIRGDSSAVRHFPNLARPAGAPTGKPSPFHSLSSPLFFPEFMSSNSFPASSPFLPPSVLQSLKTVFSQRVSHVVIFITHSLKMDNTTKYAVSTFQLFEVREYPVV